MKVMEVLIVIDALDTVIATKGLVHPKYKIVEIGQSTQKSPGDLRKLAVT